MSRPSLFRRLTGRGDTRPQHQRAIVPVNVTATLREAKPDGIEYAPDAALAARIRDNLPNGPSANLIAARHAAVLDQEAAFLTDRKGDVQPPEESDLIAALRFAAEHIRDGIVFA